MQLRGTKPTDHLQELRRLFDWESSLDNLLWGGESGEASRFFERNEAAWRFLSKSSPWQQRRRRWRSAWWSGSDSTAGAGSCSAGLSWKWPTLVIEFLLSMSVVVVWIIGSLIFPALEVASGFVYNMSVFSSTDQALQEQPRLDSYLEVYEGLCHVKKVTESLPAGTG